VGKRGPCKSRGLFFPMQEETTITNWEQDFFVAIPQISICS
jgi:hypothetical protein